MRRFLRCLEHLLADETGPTAVEYAVMIAMIILAVFAAIAIVGSNTSAIYNNVGQQMVDINDGGL